MFKKIALKILNFYILNFRNSISKHHKSRKSMCLYPITGILSYKIHSFMKNLR